MNIQPHRTGPRPDAGADRIGRATEPVAEPIHGRGGTANLDPVDDQVVVSDAARALHQRAVEPVAPSLDADRAREVHQRIADGFYDRTDVREVLLSRLSQALKG